MSAQLSASERLVLSRERLRQAMRRSQPASEQERSARAKGFPGGWLNDLKSSAGVGPVIEGLSRWWSQHPMRVAVMLAGEAVTVAVQPIAQRHPWGLVLGAGLLGGLLVLSRPWKSLIKPALFAGLLPQLLSSAAVKLPAQSWIAVLTSLLQSRRPPAPPRGPAAARTSSQQ